MSPFMLSSGELVSCMEFGRERPLEHSGSCACPCSPCVIMQRAVLEHIGLFRDGDRPRHVFLHAYGELRVSRELLPDEEVVEWFFDRYYEIEDAAESYEPAPVAAFGWLMPVQGNNAALLLVKAPSDPSEGRAEEALAGWAAERGLELLGPLDRSPT